MSVNASLVDAFMNGFTRLVERLAPRGQQSTQVRFDGITTVKGTVLPITHLSLPWNQFVVNITQGTVFCYRIKFPGVNPDGSYPVPDFVFNPTDNPLPIPQGLLVDQTIQFVVAPNSNAPAVGNIYINRY